MVDERGAEEAPSAPGSPSATSEASATVLLQCNGARKSKTGEKLSVYSKVCFAVGGFPNQVASSASAFFMQIYLLDIAQISPFEACLVMSIGKTCGGITDPVVGYFINKCKWTRIGRLMPWMIGCTPFMIVSYFFMWFVPPFVTGRVFWYLAFFSLYQALTTCFHVPYSTLTMFLSTDQKERDSATAYRMTLEVLGTLIGAALQGQIVASAHTSDHCTLTNMTWNVTENGTDLHRQLNDSGFLQSPAFQAHAITDMVVWRPQLAPIPVMASSRIETQFVTYLLNNDEKAVYMMAAGIIGGMYLACTVILFIGVREKDDPYAKRPGKAISFFRGFRLSMTNRPYLSLTASFLFISAAVQLEQSNFVLFCTHAGGLQDHFQNLVLTILISAVLSIPFWQWFLQRFGKKMAAFGISWMIPFAVMLVTIPSLTVAYVVAVTSGVSIAASLLLPWSMLPDVVDNIRLENPQAKGLEPIFYSSYVFFTRMSAGIALGISTLCLEFSGYRSGACKQSEGVILTLKLLIGAVPAAMIVIGLLILVFYPITEERRKETERALRMMRSRTRRLTLIG